MEINTLYDDFADEVANYEFQEEFFAEYSYCNLQFYSSSFQECLSDVASTKRPLLFFLHNRNETFSKRFCELLSTPEIENLINQSFYVMGWNMENKDLQALQDKIIIIDAIKPYINRKQPCIFFIAPNDSIVKELEEERIEKEVDDLKLITALTKIDTLLSRYITGEYFNDMTSIKYQQLMCDELSDRDYDNFEKDEHKYLKDKILYAMYGPPRILETKEIGYEEKQIKEADEIYQKIRTENNKTSKWNDRIVLSFIYNCTEPLAKDKQKKIETDPTYKSDQDFCPYPVFVLRRCKRPKSGKEPCRRFIDNNCRVYENWKYYLENNKLPQCKMIYPKNGKYQYSESNGSTSDVCLEQKYSPSSSGFSQILNYSDIGSCAVGVLSGAVLAASMFTPLAPITLTAAAVGGGATGAYAVGRSANTLVDRANHNLSIDITNSESRAAYFNIAAGAAGAVGAGATQLLASYVRSGGQVGRTVLYTVNALNGANIIVSGTATVNSCVDVVQQYLEDGQTPSTLTLVQLGSSLFFFGNSIYNFRTAATIVHETQTSTIVEINESLRSNRHRKAFNKLLKETVRTTGETQGKAEVISTIKHAGKARDDVIATLVRSNKKFNENGIRFSAGDGGIKLNGMKIEILEFGSLPKTQQGVFMEKLPSMPESITNVRSTTNAINNMKLNKNLAVFGTAGAVNPSSIISILGIFKQELKEKVLQIYKNFMNQLDINLILDMHKLVSGNIHSEIIEYIVNFIRRHAMAILNEFKQKILNEDVMAVCRQFGFKNPSITIDTVMENIINTLLNSAESMMNTLKQEFETWYISLTYNEEKKAERKRNRHEGSKKIIVICKVCGGHYYKNQS